MTLSHTRSPDRYRPPSKRVPAAPPLSLPLFTGSRGDRAPGVNIPRHVLALRCALPASCYPVFTKGGLSLSRRPRFGSAPSALPVLRSAPAIYTRPFSVSTPTFAFFSFFFDTHCHTQRLFSVSNRAVGSSLRDTCSGVSKKFRIAPVQRSAWWEGCGRGSVS